MKRPAIRITVLERRGKAGCHRGHKPGDSFDFDTERGRLCPMAMHVAFPYIDILRYGGTIPNQPEGTAKFCCPDPDTMLIFQVEKVKDRPSEHEINPPPLQNSASDFPEND